MASLNGVVELVRLLTLLELNSELKHFHVWNCVPTARAQVAYPEMPQRSSLYFIESSGSTEVCQSSFPILSLALTLFLTLDGRNGFSFHLNMWVPYINQQVRALRKIGYFWPGYSILISNLPIGIRAWLAPMSVYSSMCVAFPVARWGELISC